MIKDFMIYFCAVVAFLWLMPYVIFVLSMPIVWLYNKRESWMYANMPESDGNNGSASAPQCAEQVKKNSLKHFLITFIYLRKMFSLARLSAVFRQGRLMSEIKN